MPILVQKYGGSSVATVEKLRKVAERIVAVRRTGADVVVVVSAMGKTTDELLGMAKAVNPEPGKRELDMLLSVGERVSMALLCMAVESLGVKAVSLTGSQSGIITNDSHSNARIIDVRPVRILDELAHGNVVIVAGFQGMSWRREVTTLGRGGSDTTAVALAAALKADSCEICSDVDGVYTADPRIVPDAQRLVEIDYDDMETLGRSGAKVLHPEAVVWAKNHGLRLLCSATFDPLSPGAAMGNGTVVVRQAAAPNTHGVTGVTSRKNETRMTWEGPISGARAVYEAMIAATLPPCRLTQTQRDGDHVRISAIFQADEVYHWQRFLDALGASRDHLSAKIDAASVTMVGPSLSERGEKLLAALDALSGAAVAVEGIETGPGRLTFLVPAAQVDDAVRVLHQRFVQALPG